MTKGAKAQKRGTFPGRAIGGVIFLLLALAVGGLAALVFVLYVFKQNNLPWTVNAVLLSMIALIFLAVSIGLFMPTPSAPNRLGMNYCPGCGIQLQKKYSLEMPCPNPKCDKMLGPDDWASKHCFSCGTEILHVVGQITGQFPAIQKSSTQIPPR